MRELLERLRPAGSPGPATVAGVPADRRRSAEEELVPVFDALTGVVVECDNRRRAARDDATRLVAEAEQRGRAVIAKAHASVEAERANAATRLHEASAAELEALGQRARIEADRVRHETAGRNEMLVKRVIDLARSHLFVLSTSDPKAPAERWP
jgi:hypothetical protein